MASTLTGVITDANKKILDKLAADTKANELKEKQQMGKEQFLNLITEQLKNQDPLSPMQDQQFISQMAQLQSLDTNNSLLTYVKGSYSANTEIVASLKTMNDNIKVLIEKMNAASSSTTTPVDTLSTDAVTIVNELAKINKSIEAYFTK